MRIAQVSPLIESVPPRLYGGTERVVSYLTEELVRMGHEVTLYATADSVTSARLVPMAEQGLRLAGAADPLASHLLLIDRVFRDAHQYDFVHFHVDYLHYPLAVRFPLLHVTTAHGRQDLPELARVYRAYPTMPLASVSDAQREPVSFARWVATVYHGLPLDLHRLHPQPGSYLAFLGRLSPEKGGEKAIEVARRAGMPLKVAGKVDRADREYFESVVEPLLDGGDVEFVGELNDQERDAFLGDAIATLFLIDWPEPFGMVMIESMATGTPVIAMRRGSVPEVMEEGVTGFVVDDVDQAVEAVARVGELDRRRVRAEFERRFDAVRMAREYAALYEWLLQAGEGPRPGWDGSRQDGARRRWEDESRRPLSRVASASEGGQTRAT